MTGASPPSDSDPTQLGRRVAELRESLRDLDPLEMALRTGSIFHPDSSAFSLHLFGNEVKISYPDLVVTDHPGGAEAPVFLQALLLYYFSTADGAPVANRWISFSELPDGKFYTRAFQGYTGAELGRVFREDLESFEKAAVSIGGRPALKGPETPGDIAYSFLGLPRLPLLVAAWQGDEDFLASYQVLFDSAASHYLPTDGCAILASSLVRRLTSHQR